MTKFNTKRGLFATTGTLSPQAKREYIDNFPSFELEYLEGNDIVDIVLSHPILSAVWFDGVSITSIRHILAIPFLIRHAESDRPVENLDKQPLYSGSDLQILLSQEVISLRDFAPYRPPATKTMNEYDRMSIRCMHAVCRGVIHLHEVPLLLNKVVAALTERVKKDNATFIMRLGTPSLASLQDDELKDRIPLSIYNPVSYVVPANSSAMLEKDWILPHSQNWIFPSRLSTLEAEWAGWYNKNSDCCLMIEINWPTDENRLFIYQQLQETREEWLRSSIFLTTSIDNLHKLKQSFVDYGSPIWECDYGPSGKLIAILHPCLRDEHHVLTFGYDQETGTHKWIPDEISTKFLEDVIRIRNKLAAQKLMEITWERAIHIAAAAGEDLLQKPTYDQYRSAELVHFYEELPSPSNLLGRRIIFVSMWEISGTPHEAREILVNNQPKFSHDLELYWEVNYNCP